MVLVSAYQVAYKIVYAAHKKCLIVAMLPTKVQSLLIVVISGKALEISCWFLALSEITTTFMLAALGIR